MNNEDEILNESRRNFLIKATSIVGLIGTCGASIPFIGSWGPNDKAKAAGAPVTVNIENIDPGDQIIAEWRGKPIFILHRTKKMLKTILDTEVKLLADPASNNSEQPPYINKKLRSIKPEYGILVGLCTHLGCSPTFRAPQDLGKNWNGGYFCPCHGSNYDLAGRVYKGQPAPTNLPIPPHKFESDHIITIGVDKDIK